MPVTAAVHWFWGPSVALDFVALMCCSNVGFQWQTRNRSTVREKNGGLTQPLALEQSGGRTGALLSKNVDRTAKSLLAFFSDHGRSLEWYTVQRQVPSIKFT
jgi:hypothetical protein